MTDDDRGRRVDADLEDLDRGQYLIRPDGTIASGPIDDYVAAQQRAAGRDVEVYSRSELEYLRENYGHPDDRDDGETTEYAAGVSAFGNVRVEADSDADAVEKLNAALEAVDTGDLSSLTVDYVEAGADRWEQSEARERGIRE